MILKKKRNELKLKEFGIQTKRIAHVPKYLCAYITIYNICHPKIRVVFLLWTVGGGDHVQINGGRTNAVCVYRNSTGLEFIIRTRRRRWRQESSRMQLRKVFMKKHFWVRIRTPFWVIKLYILQHNYFQELMKMYETNIFLIIIISSSLVWIIIFSSNITPCLRN